MNALRWEERRRRSPGFADSGKRYRFFPFRAEAEARRTRNGQKRGLTPSPSQSKAISAAVLPGSFHLLFKFILHTLPPSLATNATDASEA